MTDTQELAVLSGDEIAQSTPDRLRAWAVGIRRVIPTLNVREQLERLESSLTAIARHLKKLGEDAREAEISRTLAMQRIGELLPPAEHGGDRRSSTKSEKKDLKPRAQVDHDSQCRLLAQEKDAVARAITPKKPGHAPKVSVSRVVKQAREARREREQVTIAPTSAMVTLASFADWLPVQPDCDLLLTDPPYSTDVPDVYAFADSWLPLALKKVKPTGRAYVCIGAYPAELHAYLSVPCGDLTLANVLVWTYRNTLGPSPSLGYKLNWQAVLYYHGPDAPPLDSPKMTEQFSVADINAPDGRQGDRYHAWQKPSGLAERFIRHATKPGDLVLDPFAGTGTFLLAAATLGRHAAGCDTDPAMLTIASERGCHRAQ